MFNNNAENNTWREDKIKHDRTTKGKCHKGFRGLRRSEVRFNFSCNLIGNHPVDNHSSYVQQLAWLIWIHTKEKATEENFADAQQDLIDQNSPLFEKQTENLSSYQMNFLRALVDGVKSEFSTQEVLQKYQLGSSANVSIIKRALIKKELIEVDNKQISLADPVLKLWLMKELTL